MLTRRWLAVGLALLNAAVAPAAQSRPPVLPADSARWESLVTQGPRLGLSPDGRFLTYRIDRSNWEDELRVTRIADGKTLVIAYGRDPEYSADSRWLAVSFGRSSAEEDQLRRDRRPVRDGLALIDLTALVEARVSDVERFSFSPDGAFLAFEHYDDRAAASARGGGRRGGSNAPPVLTIRTLADGTDASFGNVDAFAWQPGGHRVAMAMGGDNQSGARMQVVDPSMPGGAGISVLDASGSTFARPTWRPDGADLAFLRSRNDGSGGNLAFDLVVARNAGTARPQINAIDASRAGSGALAPGEHIVDTRSPAWSADGAVVFVGVGSRGSSDANSDLRIWHWTDVEVMPRQEASLAADRRASRLAAIQVDAGTLAVLEPSMEGDAQPLGPTAKAWVADGAPYAMARTIGRPAADLSIVDARTNARWPFATAVDELTVDVRPDGGALVFEKDNKLWSLDVGTRAVVDLSSATGGAFVDLASDDTAPEKPLFGIAGWTTDGAVLAHDRYDLWRVSVDGRNAKRLTAGAATRVRRRLARPNDDDDAPVDVTRPMYLALFDPRTKESGYERLQPGGAEERLIFGPQQIDRIARAADADVFAYTAQDFDDSPDIFVADARLEHPRQVTATNPQQSNFSWGRSTVIDFTTSRGEALQAALYYPAGYVAGRKYPTIVKVYERLSDEVHEYVAPSDMGEANIAIFTGLGYAVIAPDIRYRPRDPGLSAAEAATAAVARAVALGVTDPARVGVIGHSWGAYESAFLATHTTGVFAAAVAGAPITDLISQAGDHHWETGVAETDHIETGQQRMQVPFYDDVDAYVRNSPIFGVPTMTTPLLIETGDDDGEVFWHQSVELYNAARRAKKPVVMLVYKGEGHVLDDFDHERDYQRRILDWFGHYLKNEAAPAWITTGTPLIKR